MLDESPLQKTNIPDQVSVNSEVTSSLDSKAENFESVAHNSLAYNQNSAGSIPPGQFKTNYDLSSLQSFDSWIDNLVEFKETVLQTNIAQISIAKVLYKLDASRDIPAVNVKLIIYDGNSLAYVEFIERFKRG